MKIKPIIFLSLIIFGLLSFTAKAPVTKYKCMIYEKTLYVQGDDSEWYNTIEEWWKKFYGKKRTKLDAITGATISGGGRNITVVEIDDSKINAGYKIRFETAVEDQQYHTSDVEFELTTETVKSKKDGTGFIRYVRMMPN